MKHLLRPLRLILLLALWPCAVHAALPIAKPLSPAQAAAVDQAVEAEIAKQQLVGVAVGILRDGQIAYVKGYGLADREQKTPVTTETEFNWASNSKPLAAVAAMQLVDEKKLDLDADVRTLVPEFPDPGAVITCRHLSCHQSGIVHYDNGRVVPTVKRYDSDLPFLDPVVALDKFNKSPLLFQPGAKTSYSSHAYILLSAVIQRAGKADFHQQIEERIAKPLKMTRLERDFSTRGQPNWSAGYTKSKDAIVATPEEAHYWKHGAGGYKSNIEDFARWAEGLLNHRLVSEETTLRMWTPQKNAAGEPTTWGLGFTVETQNNTLKVSHNGSQPESTTRMVLYPRARHGMVVMTNCQYAKVGDISTAVYAALK